jgi:hypothetical protein
MPDNYVTFALSVYSKDSFKIANPIEPKGPWQTIPKENVNPVPKKPILNGNFTSELFEDPTPL